MEVAGLCVNKLRIPVDVALTPTRPTLDAGICGFPLLLELRSVGGRVRPDDAVADDTVAVVNPTA